MRHRSLGLLLALLPLQGCCSLARLFCGPDTSKWVSVRFDTPERTVATFFEAIRRDAPDVIWECLAKSFLERKQLDSVTLQVGWQKLRDETTGLHLVGYAEVPPPLQRTAREAKFLVDVHGTRIELDLVCESFWELTWRRDNGTQGGGPHPAASFGALASIERVAEEQSQLVVRPLQFEHLGETAVPLEAVERAGLVRVWRIADLRVQPTP